MKRSKKLFTLAMSLSLVLSSFTFTYASEKKITLQIDNSTIFVDDEIKSIDAPPVIRDSRTFVPVRAITEALGGNATWDSSTKTATLTDSSNNEIKLTIDSNIAYLNGTPSQLDVSPVIISGRTMLPIRFVADSFGFETKWDQQTKTIRITKAEEEKAEISAPELNSENVYKRVGEDENTYSSTYPNGINAECTYVITDPSGKVLNKFRETNDISYIYKDNNGNTVEFRSLGNADMIKMIEKDGRETYIEPTEDYSSGSDESGNTYHDLYAATMKRTDKSGNTTATYKAVGETQIFCIDENMNTAAYIMNKNGGVDSGFLYPDGKYVQFKRDYTDSYSGSDGNIYNFEGTYLIITDKNYNVKEEINGYGDFSVLYTDNNGREYIYKYDENDPLGYVATLKGTDGNIGFNFDTPDNNLMKYSSDESPLFYKGSNDKIYITNGGDFEVADKTGNLTNHLTYTAVVTEYTAKDGTVYTHVFRDINDIELRRSGGNSIKLTRIN
ncbi:MAG: copper amine oxidase N-terminal domain-containing protein [Firmicutes bacterium]|nr:copper amine oxidase N-terminal domain-containing protein [Bacillota bacterium]